jgi:uncharacterized DUF497 family protein
MCARLSRCVWEIINLASERQTIGMVNGALLILVAYTVVDEEQEVLLIISARRVTHQERIEYEEASQI